jgi:group I intron endonuclease
VGSSVNLGRRFYDYFRKSYLESTQGRSYTNNALLFHGYSAFRLEILEYCEFSSCTEREQYYINLLLPEYNILKTAGSRLGSTHSQETKERISEALKVIKKENN